MEKQMNIYIYIHVYVYIYIHIYVHTLFLHALVHVHQSFSVFSFSSSRDFISFPHLFDHFISKGLTSFPNLFDQFIKKKHYFSQLFFSCDFISFKNREPIGEVGCCESRMAERIHCGPTGGWSCVFWNGCNGCSGRLTTTAGCSVV